MRQPTFVTFFFHHVVILIGRRGSTSNELPDAPYRQPGDESKIERAAIVVACGLRLITRLIAGGGCGQRIETGRPKRLELGFVKVIVGHDGSIIIQAMLRRAVFLILLSGCGGPQSQPQPAAPATPPAQQLSEAPFAYRIVSTDEKPHTFGPQVVVRLETTNEVAKAATEDDLQQLWRHLGPELGDRRVFIQLDAGVPGASLWGLITRLNLGDGWQVKVEKFEEGIDAEPYNFVDKIDRTKPNQGAMILTLPLVNNIIERLKQAGWSQTYRSEDLVKLELPAPGMESFDVTLSPEGIDLQAWHKDDSEIFAAVALLTQEFGLGDEIKRKMQSVIGSPEYFRGNSNGVGVWHWTIRDFDVSYYHTEHGRKKSIDNIDIGYHSK